MKNKSTPSRRDFLKRSSLAGVGLSTTLLSSCIDSKIGVEKKEVGRLSEAAQKLLAQFNLKYPIFQAAPGGEALAVAIAKAGGMGAISFSWSTPDEAYEQVVRMKKATEGNFYGNFILHFGTAALDKVLEAGCPTVQFSWGIPTAETVRKIRSADARLGIQVGSKLNAEKALERQPDFIICQGLEAGGHIQGTSYVADVLSEIIEVAGEVPVLVAGGIVTGHDIRKVVHQGAAGVVMGSRFVVTIESDAHELYKKKLVEAEENSTVYTICFNKEWNAMHRVLRNETFNAWEAQGCPLKGNKPGEEDTVATHPVWGSISRYSLTSPFPQMTGNIDHLAMYASERVAEIKDIPSAGQLIERLWGEFENK